MVSLLGAPRCPICTGGCSKAVLTGDWVYWRCLECYSSHLSPQPSPEYLRDFYRSFHRTEDDGGVLGDFTDRMSEDFPRKARLVSTALRRKLPSVPKEQLRVLDIGCASGDFALQLKDYLSKVAGIDISPEVVQQARKSLPDADIRCGDLAEQSDWECTFHAATVWATIEHVPNPSLLLTEIRRVLRPGGLAFIDTGRAGGLIEKTAPGFLQWYDAPQHLWVFSRCGLKILLEQSRFQVVSFDLNWERSTLRRSAKSIRNLGLALGGCSIEYLKGGRKHLERLRSQRKMPYGNLMLAIAQKR